MRHLLIVAMMLFAPSALAEEPASRYSWSSETWSQHLSKRAKDRTVIFGARLSGTIQFGKLSLVSRVDASALPDGGGREGSVSFDDPASFQSLEGYVGANYHLWGPISATVVGGMSVDVEGARVRTFEQTPVTIAGGVRIAALGGYLYLMVGRHDAAGKGLKELFAVKVPVVSHTSLIADGAIGGPLSFVRYGVALTLR